MVQHMKILPIRIKCIITYCLFYDGLILSFVNHAGVTAAEYGSYKLFSKLIVAKDCKK